MDYHHSGAVMEHANIEIGGIMDGDMKQRLEMMKKRMDTMQMMEKHHRPMQGLCK